MWWRLAAALALLAGLKTGAWAVNPDTLGLIVDVSAPLSVNIVQASYDFTPLAAQVGAGAVTRSETAVGVDNDTTGTIETYQLSVTNPSGWTAGAAAGVSVYNLRAVFNATLPLDGDFLADDDLTTTAQTATAAVFSTGGQTGVSVAPSGGAERSLWFRLALPTATTAGERTITVTVNAT